MVRCASPRPKFSFSCFSLITSVMKGNPSYFERRVVARLAEFAPTRHEVRAVMSCPRMAMTR